MESVDPAAASHRSTWLSCAKFRMSLRFIMASVVFLLLAIVAIVLGCWFYHKSVNVVGSELLRMAALTDDMSVFHRALNNILIPRVVGTPGHDQVRKFIITEMTQLGWSVDTDDFSASTPVFGVLPFSNIIATHHPRARRFLDLACHYDSKYFPNQRFLAATDSAVPCAMIISLAHSFNRMLDKTRNNELSLRLIFFDGEEAFKSWTAQDSLYGSRHLAAKWDETPYPEAGGDATQLDRTDVLVLLDLLGASSPTFYSFFSNTHGWYKVLMEAETKLAQAKLLASYDRRYFQRMSTDSSVQDDHTPFLERDVPILHLITVPFPKVWHTLQDDGSAIDMTTTHNLLRIISIFVAEYLHLSL